MKIREAAAMSSLAFLVACSPAKIVNMTRSALSSPEVTNKQVITKNLKELIDDIKEYTRSDDPRLHQSIVDAYTLIPDAEEHKYYFLQAALAHEARKKEFYSMAQEYLAEGFAQREQTLQEKRMAETSLKTYPIPVKLSFSDWFLKDEEALVTRDYVRANNYVPDIEARVETSMQHLDDIRTLIPIYSWVIDNHKKDLVKAFEEYQQRAQNSTVISEQIP